MEESKEELKSLMMKVKEETERDGNYQTTWHAFWETCMQVRKQQLQLDMEQQTVSK